MGTPIDPEQQLIRFREGVELLGGQRAAARALDVNERTMRALYNAERPLHIGFLQDMAKALRLHARKCTLIERYLAPEFTDNLTEAQATKPPHPNSSIGRAKRLVKDTDAVCTTCRWRAGHAPDCPRKGEPWPTMEVED